MIRKNDMVQVTTGKHKGKTGKVLSVLPLLSRVVVEKVNLVKRHQRPTQKLPQGGIIEKEAPLAISNVMIYCNRCHKGVRVGIKLDKDGKKNRVCKKCGENIGQ